MKLMKNVCDEKTFQSLWKEWCQDRSGINFNGFLVERISKIVARDAKMKIDIAAVLKKERNRIQQRTYITINQRQFQWLVVDEIEKDLKLLLEGSK